MVPSSDIRQNPIKLWLQGNASSDYYWAVKYAIAAKLFWHLSLDKTEEKLRSSGFVCWAAQTWSIEGIRMYNHVTVLYQYFRVRLFLFCFAFLCWSFYFQSADGIFNIDYSNESFWTELYG